MGDPSGRRFVLTCHDAGGTVPPMLSVAQALVASGAQVTVLGQPSVAVRALAIGCSFEPFSVVGDYDRARTLEDQLENTLPALVGASTGHDLRRVVRSSAADTVLVDANLAGALSAAESMEDVRSFVLLHSMYRTYVDVWLGEIWPMLADLVHETRAAFGCDPVDSWAAQFARHAGSLSVVTPSFEAPVEPPMANQRHFGFLVPAVAASAPTPALPLGDRPLALVSLSTTFQDQAGVLDAIVEAARPHARLLVTTSGYGGSTRTFDDVVVVDSVPHASVLADVDVVICHAGLGTIAAALSFGVPLVCSPVGRDQHLNTERVQALGIGVGVASVDEVGEAVARVLGDPSFRAAAVRQAEESRKAGGATVAAAWLAGEPRHG